MRKDYYLHKAFFRIDLIGVLIIAIFLMMLFALYFMLKRKSNYTNNVKQFSGWYNDKDSLISSDFHYPYNGSFQMKDSVLNLTAKFKNVE